MRLTRNKLRRMILSEIRRSGLMNEQFGLPLPPIPGGGDLGDMGVDVAIIEDLQEALKDDFDSFVGAAMLAFAACQLGDQDLCIEQALNIAANTIENAQTKEVVLDIILNM